MEYYPGLGDSPPRRNIDYDYVLGDHPTYSSSVAGYGVPKSLPDRNASQPPYGYPAQPMPHEAVAIRRSAAAVPNVNGHQHSQINSRDAAVSYFETVEPMYFSSSRGSDVQKSKRVLVGDPPAAKLNGPAYNPSYAQTGSNYPSQFGLGVGRYGNEIPSPLDAEIQQTILEMQQELAYVDTLPNPEALRHSRRLLKERCAKLESTVDPDWVEVDINKPIRVTKRILIPTFRHPTYNYVGRILGAKGITLQNICKKYKSHISVMGAGSSKDRNKELDLLNTGDPRYAHYASPLHVRIDIIAPPHIAHMRLAGCLNVLHKLLVPNKDVYIEGITEGGERNDDYREKRISKEEEDLEKELDTCVQEEYHKRMERRGGGPIRHGRMRVMEDDASENNGDDVEPRSPSALATHSPGLSMRGKGSVRGGRGGFVPKARVKTEPY